MNYAMQQIVSMSKIHSVAAVKSDFFESLNLFARQQHSHYLLKQALQKKIEFLFLLFYF
ncbi:hypothetical protein [Holospora curviuscula]|uniref:Uncharacterized protein n=1 Tax=Holospora curviuscula TaxID=1082868 RepID=A0A2S5R974_9PROT|nr:hypothetical protein [Holospora curviuscula]PPE03850.1 hypothetical protein HCUR_00627 [Holospora curviuscula]